MANHVIPEEPTRENEQETNYNNSLERMGQNIGKLLKSLKYLGHFDHHYDPKIKHKIQASIDDTSQFPDKLEVLKDQNMKLKSK